MEICGVIYLITNLLNGMKYVGQTTRSVKLRFREHAKRNSPLGNAIQKYGAENFTIEILEECKTKKQLNEREIFWVAHFNCMIPNGYNRTGGGSGSIIPQGSTRRSEAAAKGWASKSKEERSDMAKKRESRKSPEARSESAKKAAATRIQNLANRTPEKKAAESVRRSKAMKKSWAEKPDEKKAEINKAKKERIAAKTPEERRQMIEPALEASKKRTHEDRSEAVRKGRARMTPEARVAMGQKISIKHRSRSHFKNLLEEIEKRQFTYSSLAKLMGLSLSAFSYRMRGVRNFSESDIAKLMEIFGLPAEYLMKREA